MLGLGSEVGVEPIPLSRRPSFLSELFGLGDAGTYTGISRRLAAAVADRSVKRIILLVDSPGGAALGVEELADEIRRANAVKPVVAVVDVLMASAALWLGQQYNMLMSMELSTGT